MPGARAHSHGPSDCRSYGPHSHGPSGGRGKQERAQNILWARPHTRGWAWGGTFSSRRLSFAPSPLSGLSAIDPGRVSSGRTRSSHEGGMPRSMSLRSTSDTWRATLRRPGARPEALRSLIGTVVVVVVEERAHVDSSRILVPRAPGRHGAYTRPRS